MEIIRDKILKVIEEKDFSQLNIKELEMISNIYVMLKEETQQIETPTNSRIIKGGK